MTDLRASTDQDPGLDPGWILHFFNNQHGEIRF